MCNRHRVIKENVAIIMQFTTLIFACILYVSTISIRLIKILQHGFHGIVTWL